MTKIESFNGLTKEQFEAIKPECKYIEIPKNSILFYQDDICKEILFLQSGEVTLYMSADLDEEISLYTLKAGDQCIINTSSALSNTKTIGSAKTATDIKGWLVPIEVIQNLITTNSDYQKFIFSLFALRFNALTTLVEDIKFKRLDSRVLDYLKKKEQTMIHITHEEIANDLGSSRVVISRVLKDMENRGFVKLHRGRIELM